MYGLKGILYDSLSHTTASTSIFVGEWGFARADVKGYEDEWDWDA